MHPIAFDIGSFKVHWFGILVASAFLVGFWTAERRALRAGFPAGLISDAGIWLILGAVFGARTLYVISRWEEEFAAHPFPDVFMVQKGGLVFYGGLIGAMMAGLCFVRRRQVPLWKFADVLSPSIALGYFFGRFGCLMNGCCFGRLTELPWAVHYPADHVTHGDGVHPTQVYDAGLSLGLFAVLAWLHRRKKFDGQVFAAYLMSYAVLRAAVEIFRGDYPVRYLGGLATPAQLVSAVILLAGALLWWKLPRRVATQKS